MGHKVCFLWRKLIIIPKLFWLPLLIWSNDVCHIDTCMKGKDTIVVPDATARSNLFSSYTLCSSKSGLKPCIFAKFFFFIFSSNFMRTCKHMSHRA